MCQNLTSFIIESKINLRKENPKIYFQIENQENQ